MEDIQTKTFSAKNGVWLFVGLLLASICAGLIVGLAVGIYIGFTQQVLPPHQITFALFPYVTLLSGGFQIFLLKRVVYKYSDSLIDGKDGHPIGFRKVENKTIIFSILGGFLLAISALLLFYFFREDEKSPIQSLLLNATLPQLILWAFWATALAPVLEEVIFRGVLFAAFAKSWGTLRSAIIVSLLFISIHVWQVGFHWQPILCITVLSVILITLRIKTQSIWPSVALHFGYNFFLIDISMPFQWWLSRL